MKAKEGFLLRNVADDYIVVAVGDEAEDFNKLITMNSVGAFIYEQLREELSMDELVAKMLDKYDVDRALAERDAQYFVSELNKAGLLDA